MRAARLLLLLALTACSDGEAVPASRGIQHLDLRLADGRAAADVLATRRKVVRSFSVRSAATLEEDLPGWALHNARFGDAPGKAPGTGGVIVQSEAYDPARGLHHATVRFEEPFHAGDFNLIELDLRTFPTQGAIFASGSTAVTWRPMQLPADFDPGDRRISVPLERTRQVQTVRLPLGSSADWAGSLRWLELFPIASGPQTFELHGVRFVREGFGMGATPLDRALGGDGGLIGAGGDLRRTWPGDLDVPLFAEVTVPPGGRLTTQVEPAGALRGREETLVLLVELRKGEGGTWAPLVEERMDLTGESGGPATLTADLSTWAGQGVQLRFRAGLVEGTEGGGNAIGEPPPERELQQALVRWITPIVGGTPARDPRPHVVLLTLDTLRSDVLGCYGGPVATPRLDALAQQGLVFDEAWTGCNSTLPSHTSILTGLTVPSHGVIDNRSTLDPAVRTLTQELRDGGYWCAAAVSVEHLRASFSGLGRGFDQYIDCPPRSSIDGAVTVERVLDWSREWGEDARRPVFLWLHLFDPHTPYGPPADFLAEYEARPDVTVPPRRRDPGSIGQTQLTSSGGFLEGVNNRAYADHLYRAGVAYTDHLVGELVDGLAGVGMDASNTAFVITADHGEALGEGDVWYNHATLVEPIVRVPLIASLPGREGGQRIDGRVSTVDLAGSLLDYLGLPTLGEGQRLFRSPERLDPERPAWFVHSNLDQTGFHVDRTHYFENGARPFLHLGEDRQSPPNTRFLYDPEADPEFLHNLATEQPDQATAYSRQVSEWSSEQKRGRVLQRDLTAEERTQLESLGYLIGDEEAEEERGPE